MKAVGRIVVTGAAGFVGRRVVARLRDRGCEKIVCLARTPQGFEIDPNESRVEVFRGNLLSRDDCRSLIRSGDVVLHLAAGRGEKSYADAFLNSVVTTRNLLDACVAAGGVRRFVNVSSFAVYSNRNKPDGRVLDESCPVDPSPESRGNAYCFAKVCQEEIVEEYGRTHGVPYANLRPGVVYGPGNPGIHGRIGIGSFGLFLHLGGGNRVPLTYVDNCAEAIVLAGFSDGPSGETFNVVDDDLPTSREFLRRYKGEVRSFASVYVPHAVSYLLCALWERYSRWSRGQLPPVYNRSEWHVSWKRTEYSNRRLKEGLGWRQVVPTAEGLARHFEDCRKRLAEEGR